MSRAAVVGHRVVDRVELRQQAQPVVADVAVGLDAGLVPVEAQVRIEPGHADVDERLAQHVVRVGLAEARQVPDRGRRVRRRRRCSGGGRRAERRIAIAAFSAQAMMRAHPPRPEPTVTTTHDAIVIGSGQAGPFLAVRLAKAGMKTALDRARAPRRHLRQRRLHPDQDADRQRPRRARRAPGAPTTACASAATSASTWRRVKARKDEIVAQSVDGLTDWIERHRER